MLTERYIPAGLLGRLAKIAVVAPLCFANVAMAEAEGYAAPWVGTQFDGAPCRGGQGHKPRDYTQRASVMRHLIVNERFHFTSNVENLLRGENGTIPGDIHFILRSWPNHHRALNSISKYQLRWAPPEPKVMAAVECYFQRAIAFSPRDSVTYMLYGIYLHKANHLDEAMEQYTRAEDLRPNDQQIQYNLALLLVDTEKYDEAREYAEKVYDQGFPLPGLKRKLTEAGYWQGEVGDTTK